MKELIRQYAARIVDGQGTRYAAAAYAEKRLDGTWAGWLEFSPIDVDGPILSTGTGTEPSQRDRSALDGWASRLDREQLQRTLMNLARRKEGLT